MSANAHAALEPLQHAIFALLLLMRLYTSLQWVFACEVLNYFFLPRSTWGDRKRLTALPNQVQQRDDPPVLRDEVSIRLLTQHRHQCCCMPMLAMLTILYESVANNIRKLYTSLTIQHTLVIYTAMTSSHHAPNTTRESRSRHFAATISSERQTPTDWNKARALAPTS